MIRGIRGRRKRGPILSFRACRGISVYLCIAQMDAGAEMFQLRRVAPALNMTPPVFELAGMAPAGPLAAPVELEPRGGAPPILLEIATNQ